MFQGVDWNAVDGDTVHPPFPPTRCYVGIRHQSLQPLVARGTLSMKDANILKGNLILHCLLIDMKKIYVLIYCDKFLHRL